MSYTTIALVYGDGRPAQFAYCLDDSFTIIAMRPMEAEERERWEQASARALVQINHEMGWHPPAAPVDPVSHSIRPGAGEDSPDGGDSDALGYDEQAAGVGLEGAPSGRVSVLTPDEAEQRVGVTRHQDRHVIKVTANNWTILHSQNCKDSGMPLEDCPYTKAAVLTNFEREFWQSHLDEPLYVDYDPSGLWARGKASR